MHGIRPAAGSGLRHNQSMAQSAAGPPEGTTEPFPSRENIRRALSSRPHPQLGEARRSAAVLVCLHRESLLLVRRRTDPRDRWSGHIGLPGGRYEEADETLLATALRETREELGFETDRHGQVLGALGTYLARHREPDDLAIAVFVAELAQRPSLEFSDEIASAHWVELAELRRTRVSVPEKQELVDAYAPLEGDRELVIWGITYGILERMRGLA